jgi:four helix bundle protein
MAHFRFQGLEIWQLAFSTANRLYDIADELENKKLFRFAEQLRGAGMSLTNNIAEGSGSSSNKDFKNFLNYTRRSIFECANIILTTVHREYLTLELSNEILVEIDLLSRKMLSFSRTLKI